MATRRQFFSGCALCAAMGLVATAAEAQAPAASARRTILQSSDVAGTNFINHLVMVEFPANLAVARHTHPGAAAGLVLDGEFMVAMQGRPVASFKAGDSLLIPASLPHSETGGPAGCRVLVSFTVEKDKPLASPAPE